MRLFSSSAKPCFLQYGPKSNLLYSILVWRNDVIFQKVFRYHLNLSFFTHSVNEWIFKILRTWSKTRLIENVFTLTPALTLTLTLTLILTLTLNLNLTLTLNNVFGLTKWRHFLIKCTDTDSMFSEWLFFTN